MLIRIQTVFRAIFVTGKISSEFPIQEPHKKALRNFVMNTSPIESTMNTSPIIVPLCRS